MCYSFPTFMEESVYCLRALFGFHSFFNRIDGELVVIFDDANNFAAVATRRLYSADGR
jgi:hypothetical protein